MNRDRKMNMKDVKDEEEEANNEIIDAQSDSLLEHSDRGKEGIKDEKIGQEWLVHASGHAPFSTFYCYIIFHVPFSLGGNKGKGNKYTVVAICRSGNTPGFSENCG